MSVRAVAVLCFLALSVSVAAANDAERSPEDQRLASRGRSGTQGYGLPRAPGSLLLNMLIKNERDHLDRTLPAWAKVIDAWVIGVDDKNTDDSAAVIQKHLGHLPGRIVTVAFDGMGPTWTQLVDVGVLEFPNITHGIIADADFRPMVDRLDRMELDVRCSKHMYTIWTEDRNERRMDWIYRNIPGAKVKRRTHQTVEAPTFPYQEVLQTLINLPISEKTGGYQDRTPGKNERYIGFLKADLEDFPDDARSLYYLGYAYYDMFRHAFESQNGSPGQSAWDDLSTAVQYFTKRVEVGGNAEEGWFTVLKLGEINERFYRNWNEAEKYYLNCTVEDKERADPWFYLGQHYRLVGDYDRARPYLTKAAELRIPERSLFQWHYLYECLAAIELGRSERGAAERGVLSAEHARAAIELLRRGTCRKGEVSDESERLRLIERLEKVAKGEEKRKRRRRKQQKGAGKSEDRAGHRGAREREDGEQDDEEEEEDASDRPQTKSAPTSTPGAATSRSSPAPKQQGEQTSFSPLTEEIGLGSVLPRPSVSDLAAALQEATAAGREVVRFCRDGLAAAPIPGTRATVLSALEASVASLQALRTEIGSQTTCQAFRIGTSPVIRLFRSHDAVLTSACGKSGSGTESLKLATTAISKIRALCR